MFPGKDSPYIFRTAFFTGLIIILFSSCTIVKNYPAGKPFVYKTNINLIGNFPSEERGELLSGLTGQLDDSMRARKVDKLLWSVMKNPPVYDSMNADKSIIFMRALLRSLGYFSDSIYYEHSTRFERPDQYRTTIDFYVRPGRVVRLDSISYTLGDSMLQRITDSSKNSAFIKKGDPFAKVLISAEMERLTELYKNSGYFRFTRDELLGVWDTLDVSLLQPSLDPFEQLEILQRLRARRQNPTANLDIRMRGPDSASLRTYYNGNITIYPDYVADTLGYDREETMVGNMRVIQHRRKFKSHIFGPNIYLPQDSIYRLRRYVRTINRLNQIGAWGVVTIDQVPRKDQDTVDYVIRLTPKNKYSFTTNLEGSRNASPVSGNLFGVGVNINLQNRNFARAANLASTSLRYGIELGSRGSNQFIQTQQVSFNHSIFFPRFIPGINLIPDNRKDNFRTVFSFNAAYTQRFLLYRLITVNGSWGYEYQRRNLLLTLKLPNIEFSSLTKEDSLNKLMAFNPSLKNIFTDGFIASVISNMTLSGGTVNRPNVLRMNFEESGLLTGLIRNRFLDTQLYRFVKIDAEFAKLFRYRKTSIALRVFAGIGYEFNSTRNEDKRKTLPFFKQYFSGGPNSMRAWALRRLGPGSTVKEFLGVGSTPDRYGDVQLEANAEFRFPIGRPFGIKVNGAVFTDVGNVWFLKKIAGPPEEVFKLSRLGTDIAIGAGAGLRVDFNFLVVRFDYSYKVKDPSPAPINQHLQNKFFGYRFFQGDQFQLGIGYPFIF